jgi:hypothetical protein
MGKISTVGRPKHGQDTGGLMADYMGEVLAEGLSESLAGVELHPDIAIDSAPQSDLSFFSSTNFSSITGSVEEARKKNSRRRRVPKTLSKATFQTRYMMRLRS